MKRMMAAILAVLVLPACGSRDDDDDDNQLTVVNAGLAAVTVAIEHEEDDWFGGGSKHHDDYELGAGSSRTDVYPWTHQVRIQVRRKSDGLLLFSERYDFDDFEEHRQHVWITVTP